MNVDAVNISDTHLKQLGITIFNHLNNTNSTIPPSSLVFLKTGSSDKVLLQNPITKVGVLMNKISLSDLFPKTLDIRPYKKGVEIKKKILDEEGARILNDKYATNVVVIDPNVLNTSTAFDIDTVRDFFTFCRVFGFYTLSLDDVHLNSVDGKLVISVNSTHDVFTGFIEVLV